MSTNRIKSGPETNALCLINFYKGIKTIQEEETVFNSNARTILMGKDVDPASCHAHQKASRCNPCLNVNLFEKTQEQATWL